MKTLFLHAGMMKTGTTSIQVSLAANPAGANYRYIWHVSNNSSMPMRLAFSESAPREIRSEKFSEPGYRESFLDFLAEQLKQDVPKLIVSAELISATFSETDYRTMREWLVRHVPDIKVVLYIREPGSFMESIYQQALQELGHSAMRPQALYPKYRRKFEPLEAVFGRENIIYRAFAPSRFVRGDIVFDFADLLGLDFREFDVRRSNDSLSIRAASLLHVYHQHLPVDLDARLEGNDQKRRLVRLLQHIRGPKLRLPPDMICRTLQHNEEDIAWMSSRLDAPLPAYDPPADGEYIRNENDLSRLDDVSLAWLGELAGERVDPSNGPAIAAALAQASQPYRFESRVTATRRMFS